MRLAVMLGVATLAAGCVGYASPVSQRTARLLAPGHVSVTGAVGAAHYELRGDPLDAQGLALEAMGRYGASQRVELGARVSHLRWNGPFAGANTLVYVDATVGLLPDELALTLPVGVGFGDESGGGDAGIRNLQAQPGVIYSVTLGPRLGLDASFKLIATTGNDLDDFAVLSAAATVGLRVRSDDWPVEIVPELGVMVDDLTHEHTEAGDPPHAIDVGDSLLVGFVIGVTWMR